MAQQKFGEKRHRPAGDWVQTSHPSQVVGITHRKAAVLAFFAAVRWSEARNLEYGLVFERQPNNPHDRNALAVVGLAWVKPWFRSAKQQEFPLGYVPADLAKAVTRDLIEKELPISIELRSLFQRDEYLEVKFVLLGPPGYSVGKREAVQMGAPAANATDEEKEVALRAWIDSTEAESLSQGWGVAPRPYLDLAKLLRRQKRIRDEVVVLERYDQQMKAPGVLPAQLKERLRKAKAMASKAK